MVAGDTERELPPLLAALHKLPFDYADGAGIDFLPFSAFRSAEDTTRWIRAWTGNNDLNGDHLRVFGKDGTGGRAAFWLTRPGKAILEQPVAFFGV